MVRARSVVAGSLKIAWAVSGLVVVGALLAAFIFSLQPHARASSGRPSAPPSRPNPGVTSARASTMKPLPVTQYYYIVDSEEMAAAVRADTTAGADYYGAGYPYSQPIVVVVRTPDALATLESALDQTTKAGGPPTKTIDLRPVTITP